MATLARGCDPTEPALQLLAVQPLWFCSPELR